METQNTKNHETEIDISFVLQMLLQRWFVILLSAIVVGLGCFAYSKLFITPLYSSTVKMYVNNGSNMESYVTSSELTAAKELVDTYLAILETPDTMKEIISKANLSYGEPELLKMLSSGAIKETQVFYITVTSADPKEAETIAQTICEVLPDRISRIIDKSSVRIVQQAKLPTKISSPNYLQNTLIGVVLGIFLSCVVVVVVGLLTNTIKDENYPSNTYGIRTLAYIPDPYEKNNNTKGVKRNKKNKVPTNYINEISVLCNNIPSSVSEAYKILRTNLTNLSQKDKNYQVIGITSPCPQEGKSTLAINFAYTIAQSGKRVLLMEADLRRPVVAKRLSLSSRRGLANMLTDPSEELIQDSKFFDNWKILCAGTAAPNPSELLSGVDFGLLIERLRQEFDYIILDLPPVNAVSDAMAVSHCLDGLLCAVKQEETTKNELKVAMQYLAYSQAELVGFVITNAHSLSKYSRYSKYGYY